jgi:putative tryptophan/tyrosine transport system substrate-binding protein
MKRREFIAGLGAVAWPAAARAQQRALPVIGFLHNQSSESMRDKIPAFRRGLAKTGYVEGRNVATEHRWAEGDVNRRRALVADLIRSQVSVIVADTTNGGADSKAATNTIPVIFMAGADPVEFGLVSSFNRPGGNVTGLASQGVEVTGKRLELLHKLVPEAALIATIVGVPGARVTGDVGLRYAETEARDSQSAARGLGLSVIVIDIKAEGSLAAAFARLVERRARALLVSSNIFYSQESTQLILLADRHGIPTMFWDSTAVPAGALSSYGPDLFDVFRQAGVYAGRILNGEKPGDLPVVQPSKFEFAINLKTAKALGLTIPPNLLALADEVIE